MLQGMQRKLQMKFFGDILPENKTIRTIDPGVITQKYRGNNLSFLVEVYDLNYMISNLYEEVNSKRYLSNPDAEEADYEFLVQALYYYIDIAHNEGDEQFFNDLFYNKYEIGKDRLQAHFPALKEWHIEALLKIINKDYVVPVEEIEGENILHYMGRVKLLNKSLAI